MRHRKAGRSLGRFAIQTSEDRHPSQAETGVVEVAGALATGEAAVRLLVAAEVTGDLVTTIRVDGRHSRGQAYR